MEGGDFLLIWKFFHRQNSLSLHGGNEFTVGNIHKGGQVRILAGKEALIWVVKAKSLV